MHIKILEQDKDSGKLSFLVNGVVSSYLNLIRGVLIEEVPTMAIEEVEFKENNAVLYDEIIAHRLGLLVLSTDFKGYSLPKECRCKEKGCAKCQLKLTLKAKGPGIVYASSLKTKDPKIKPVYLKAPIISLLEGQSIQFIATATLGKGKEHTKWSPGHIYYHNEPLVVVNNNSKKFEEFKDKYPESIFKNDKIDKSLIIDNNLFEVCEGICDEVVKVTYDEESFIFYIESFGQLKPKEMVKKALLLIDEQLSEFVDTLKKAK
jgi:DNA-directed RNA polymerase subunit D